MKALIQEANGCITAGNRTSVEGFREQDTLRRVLDRRGEGQASRCETETSSPQTCQRKGKRATLAGYVGTGRKGTGPENWSFRLSEKPSKLATSPITKGLRPPAEEILPAAAMFEVWRNHTHYQTVDRVDTPSKTKRPVCITKNGLQKRWMKTTFCSFEQNQRHYSCLVCKLARPLICCRRSMAPPYLSLVKSRYSYFVPETEGRIDYILLRTRLYQASSSQHRGFSESRRTTSWRASWSQTTATSTENYETRIVDLSEDILGCLSCCQKTRCRWVGPNSYRMFSLWLTTPNFTLSLPRSISNFSCSLTRNITSGGMENLTFHSLLRWKTTILVILKEKWNAGARACVCVCGGGGGGGDCVLSRMYTK